MPAATDSLLGRRFGSIRLDARLGAGAMGVVYRGVHEILKKEVAVKVLGPNAHKAHARERFLREAQAAAKVSHANVVQVFEAGEGDGQTYLVMELVNGHSLGSILDEIARKAGKSAGMPPETVSRLGVGIALGLAAIHAQGIVHRDIKPDNIMVASDQTPKIADLGLAKQLTDPDILRLTGTGMVVGTPLYVAPEAIRDPETISPASDIYSLGATLYHMLTGKPPFDSPTAYEVMRAHLEDRPKPIRDKAPGVSPGLAQLIEQCLEKDPKRRPTALALAELLGRGTALKAKPNRGVVLLVTAAVLTVSGGAGVAWWFLHAAGVGQGTVAVPDGVLNISADQPRLRVRLDGGAWQEMKPEGLGVRPGHHQVQIEAVQPGPTLRQNLELDLAPAEPKRLTAELAPTETSTAVALAMPGDGLLLINGLAHSLDDASAMVTSEGVWNLARWNGTRLRTRSYEVDHLARPRIIAENAPDRLEGDACWRRVWDDGRPCPPHLVVCWWMANKLKNPMLPEPSNWGEQGNRPVQPAINLNAGLVKTVVERLSGTGLPDRQTAQTLQRQLHFQVWYRNEQGNPTVGTSGVNGLVLVPTEPAKP